MPGTLPPQLRKNRKKLMYGEAKPPSYSSVSLSPPPPRKQSGKPNLRRTRKSFSLISRAGPVVLYFFAHPARAAVQHEPDFVPAVSPVAGEMQRLRGEVRFAFPRARGWRLGSG